MTPLTTRQAIVAYGTNFAIAAQGAKANTAVQPGEVGTTIQPYSARLKSLADATDGTTGQIVGRAADGKLQFQNAGAGDMISMQNLSDVNDKNASLVSIGASAGFLTVALASAYSLDRSCQYSHGGLHGGGGRWRRAL